MGASDLLESDLGGPLAHADLGLKTSGLAAEGAEYETPTAALLMPRNDCEAQVQGY